MKGYGELDFKSIQHIIDNCVGLKEINLTANHLSEDSMNYLVNNLRPTLKKLSLGKIIEVKGQLISKANCQAEDSPKKRTNEFVFTTVRRIFVRFLGESSA